VNEDEWWGTPAPLILAIDGDPETLARITATLSGAYRVDTTTTAAEAIRMLGQGVLPNLVVVDTGLLNAGGSALCEELRESKHTHDIPIVFLINHDSASDIECLLKFGAVDFVSKPICGPVLAVRVVMNLTLNLQASILKSQNESLRTNRSLATAALGAVREVTFGALTAVAKIRSIDSEDHLLHTQRLVELLALELADHPRFSDVLTDDNIKLIAKSAPLHDLGKVGIPDHILLKPGKLSAEEFEIMKSHTVIGYQSIIDAETLLGKGENNFLQFGCEITLSHHERWDGSGYPAGLAGTQIPASARILAVADVYDAFISHRLYKGAQPHDMAVALIQSGRGTAFDPDVVDAFDHVSDDFNLVEHVH
jgi:putative two-component system response regulator